MKWRWKFRLHVQALGTQARLHRYNQPGAFTSIKWSHCDDFWETQNQRLSWNRVNYWIERIPFLPKKSDFQDIVSDFLIFRKWVALTWWLQEGPGSSAGPARKWFPCSSVGNLIAVFVGCWAALLLDSSGNTKKSLWEKRRDCRSNMQLFRIFGHATNLESRCYHRSFFKWQQDLDSLNIFPRSGPRWRLLDFNLKCGTLIITPVWWLFFLYEIVDVGWTNYLIPKISQNDRGCWMNNWFFGYLQSRMIGTLWITTPPEVTSWIPGSVPNHWDWRGERCDGVTNSFGQRWDQKLKMLTCNYLPTCWC